MMEENMKRASKVLLTSFFANLFLSFAKIIAGFLGTSQSLIADGLHSFSDLATDIVALIGNKFASRPADIEHPLGHGRLEYITSMFIALVIVGLGFTLVKESILSERQIPDFHIVYIIALTIIVKFCLANYVLKSGKQSKNQILISSGRESFTDVFSSLLVLFIVVLSQFQNHISWLSYLDKIGGVSIGLVILLTGAILLKENISILIGQCELDPEFMDQIKNVLAQLSIDGDIQDVMLMKYGPYYQANIVLAMQETNSLKEYFVNINKIREMIQQQFENISYINVQVVIKK